ncbi:MAG: hypothetical protein QXH03_02915 [Candidatus Bathyarchaeia archaeon]
MGENQDLGGLKPEIVKKPKVIRCPKCGSTEFLLRKTITVNDRLIIDEESGVARIELENINESMAYYQPLQDCDEIVCAECETPIPKENFNEIPKVEYY